MARPHEDVPPRVELDWVEQGTQLCRSATDGLTEDSAAEPSLLPGWSRKHVLAHLAANAEAVARLVHWAATGEETPMYTSPDQRAADIEQGAQQSLAELVAWFDRSAASLAADLAALGPEQWSAQVVTAQGRTVPAAETPWMRSRELMVHAVDLGTGVTFADLPPAFLEALVDDVLGKRGREADVSGSLAGRAAYLTGRADGETAGVRALDGGPAPELPPWL
jgi:maleylpyruvate isomerase